MADKTVPVNKRILRTMSYIEWEGRGDWEAEENPGKSIIQFIMWMKDQMQYIGEGSLRQILTDYYIDGIVGSIPEGFYTKRADAETILFALYNKHTQRHWKELQNEKRK